MFISDRLCIYIDKHIIYEESVNKETDDSNSMLM